MKRVEGRFFDESAKERETKFAQRSLGIPEIAKLSQDKKVPTVEH